ncbi:MAG: 4Fe-4S dicluster domain-containing protein [Candidatus Marinimicrobia bacterium]|nr:4Fe-4S dicluster domain-containing protein [Candidatus Neomarinimicrobiota bacterium]
MRPESRFIPDHTWLAEVQQTSGVNVSLCFQCGMCSSGCPVTFAMDYLPHQIIHLIRMGQKSEVLSSASIWICASCETCTTRCPNDIEIAGIMDAMRITARRSGLKPGDKNVPIFHAAIMSSIRSKGRVFELGMIGNYTLRSGGFFAKLKSGVLMEDAKLGWQLFKRGKLKILPRKIQGHREIKKLFKNHKNGVK